MKLLALLLCFVLATFSVSAQYSYCGQPCQEPNRIVCAFNENCYDVFTGPCQMKKRNCDRNERFREVGMASCLMGQRKCR